MTTAYPITPALQKIRFWLSYTAGLLGFGYLMVAGGYIWRGDFTVQVAGFALALIVALAWMIWRAVVWMDQLPRSGLELGFLAGLAAVFVALLASPDPRQGFARAGWLLGYVVLFYFLVNLLASDLDRWGMLAGLATIAGLALAQAVAETFLWYRVWFQAAGSLSLPPSPYRFSGLLSSSIPLMALANLLMPAVILSLLKFTRPLVRILAGAWLVLYALAVPFSSSRGGWLGLVVCLAAGAAFWAARVRPWRAARSWNRGRKAAAFAGMLLALLALVLGAAGFIQVFASSPSHGGDPFGVSGRDAIWANALRIWQASPWVGSGPGRFGLEYLKAQPGIPPGFWAVHAHNLFLQVLAEFGLLGLAAGGALLALLVSGALRCYRRTGPELRPWTAALLAGLAGLLAQLCFDEFTTWSAVMVPAVFLLAWIWTAPPDLPVFNRVGLGWLVLPAGLLIGGMGWGMWAYQPLAQWKTAAAAGDWTQAAGAAAESARRDPSFFYYEMQAGLLWAWQAEYQVDAAGRERARAALARSLALEPSISWNWANLAVLDQAAGDPGAALEHLNRALALSPGAPEYWLNRGYLYEQSGSPALALNDYRRALELAPGWAGHPFWQTSPLRRQLAQAAPPELPAAARQARAAIADHRLEEAARLAAFDSALGDAGLEGQVTAALLAEARGDPQPFAALDGQLDQARFYLDPGLNFYMDAMIANRVGTSMQLVPGFLQLAPDVGQFAILQRQVDALIRAGDCPSAQRLASLQQDLVGGFARPRAAAAPVCQ